MGFGTQVGSRAAYGDATVDVVRRVPRALAEKIARQYAAKYGRAFSYRPTAKQYQDGHVFRGTPSKLIVFDVKEFNTSATRFTFSRTP